MFFTFVKCACFVLYSTCARCEQNLWKALRWPCAVAWAFNKSINNILRLTCLAVLTVLCPVCPHVWSTAVHRSPHGHGSFRLLRVHLVSWLHWRSWQHGQCVAGSWSVELPLRPERHLWREDQGGECFTQWSERASHQWLVEAPEQPALQGWWSLVFF